MWICPTCGEKNYDDPECRQCHVAQPGSLLALSRQALAPSGSGDEADDAGTDHDEERASASEPPARNRRPAFKVKANLRELGLDRRRPAEDSDESADDDDDVTGEDEDVDARPGRRPSIPQLLLIAVAVILVVLSVVGFGRWAGSSSVAAHEASVPPAVSQSPSPTADGFPAPLASVEPKAAPTPSSSAVRPRASATAAGTKPAKATTDLQCDTGCIKGTAPDGTPTWIGGSGGAGLPCCGELAEAKAKATPKAKCDTTCMYNGRCQILSSGPPGSGECCKPIKDEYGCAK